MKSIQTQFKEFVLDWCRRQHVINHTDKNPKFFLTEGWVSTGAKDFLQHARPETSPCVQMDSTRSIGTLSSNDNIESYGITLYFCVRSAKMADGETDDEALDEADYLRKLFKCHFIRERDEKENPLLRGAIWKGGASVPMFHDGWVALEVTINVMVPFNRCMDAGTMEEAQPLSPTLSPEGARE